MMKPTEQLTLFPGASLNPANRLALPGSEEARKMTATSGQKCLELYKKSDPLGYLVKMLLASSIWASMTHFLTWRMKGTKRRRLLFRLVPSEPRIEGIGCLLWRTPEAGDSANRNFAVNNRGEPKLSAQVKAPGYWPTPTVNGNYNRAGLSPTSGDGLATAVRHSLWPTPAANEHKYRLQGNSQQSKCLNALQGGQLNPAWVGWLMNFPPGWLDVEE